MNYAFSFMGSGRQKAKWLTMASLTMAVGSFVMALPHFTSGKYEWGQNVVLSCNGEGMVYYKHMYVWWLICATSPFPVVVA